MPAAVGDGLTPGSGDWGGTLELRGSPPSFAELHATVPWFFRRCVPGSWREEMPSHLQDLFLERHGDTLLRLGYLTRAQTEQDVQRGGR